MLIAIGIGWDGRRQVLAIEVAHRESAPSWSSFLRGLKDRGLHGVEYVVSDDHDGLVKAIRETLTGVHWQRCYVGCQSASNIDPLPASKVDPHGACTVRL